MLFLHIWSFLASMQRQKSNNARLRRQDPLWARALRFLDSSFISFLRKGAMEENRQAIWGLDRDAYRQPKSIDKSLFFDVPNDVAINDRSIPGNEDLVGVSSRHLVYYLPWPSTIGLNERSDGCWNYPGVFNLRLTDCESDRSEDVVCLSLGHLRAFLACVQGSRGKR
jgi:hypothetical protein